VGVITVDDQTVFLEVARDVIDVTAGFEHLGEASCGEEALELADAVDPDLVVLDVRMPGLGGFETARRLSASHPTATIVLISADTIECPSSAVRACGAAALVPKEELGPAMLRRLWAEHGPSGRRLLE